MAITLEQVAERKEQASWVPACGGNEKPFMCKGRKLQYMWNTFTKQHAYYDMTNDVFLEQDQLIELGLA
tara:strand:+ start:399 stop:605 length:207 start_codon:yes stop_codon:yes gene_type:complete